jgi:hypothetical protein
MKENIRIPVCVWIKTKRKRGRERAFSDVVFLTLPYENKKMSHLIIFREDTNL